MWYYICRDFAFTFAQKRRDNMKSENTNIYDEVCEKSTDECKKEICDMIMSIDNDKLVFYLYGFVKSTIEAWE